MNPYANTFANAINQRNAQMSFDSLREGQGYLDSILRRGNDATGIGQSMFGTGQGMFGAAGNQIAGAGQIESQNQNALTMARGYGSDLTNQENMIRRNFWDMLGRGRDMNAQGQLDFFKTVGGGDASSGAANRSQMFSGIGNSVGGMIGGMNFGGMFGGGGQIGGAAGGGMPAGAAYRLGSDMN